MTQKIQFSTMKLIAKKSKIIEKSINFNKRIYIFTIIVKQNLLNHRKKTEDGSSKAATLQPINAASVYSKDARIGRLYFFSVYMIILNFHTDT